MIILNTKTGQTYSTIAEAARKTGASASGISRVVSGQRQSAGGYGWARIETPAAAAPLVKAAAAAERRQKRESPARYERTKAARAKSRKKATQTRHKEAAKAKQAQKAAAAAPAKPKRPRVPPELQIKRADTLEKIMQINELRRRLQAEYAATPLPSTREEIAMIDKIIATYAGDETAPGGYLPESKKFVSGYALPELDRMGQQITETISEITVVSDKQLSKLFNDYRRNISKDTLEQNYNIYAGFLEAIGMARELSGRTSGKGRYAEIYNAIINQAIDATPEAILHITQEILQRDKENKAITKSWVKSVLKQWEKELGKGGKTESDEPQIIIPNWGGN